MSKIQCIEVANPRALTVGDGLEFDIARHIESPTPLTVNSADGQPLWSGTLIPIPASRRGFIAMAHAPVLVGPQSGARR